MNKPRPVMDEDDYEAADRFFNHIKPSKDESEEKQ